MGKYTYTFNLKDRKLEIEACNLVTACENILNDPFGLSNFEIQKRGTQYLMQTPFNERTHIVVFNGSYICEVAQKIN
jgi:hypothetical protein